jgi:hypothetical protein
MDLQAKFLAAATTKKITPLELLKKTRNIQLHMPGGLLI